MELPTTRIEEFLHHRVPLSKAMNIQATGYTKDTLTLFAPKFVNTVESNQFSGGSMTLLGTFAAWGLLQLGLQRLDIKVVTRLMRARWKRLEDPEDTSAGLSARCQLPNDREWQQFLRMIARKSEGGIKLKSSILDGEREIATLTCEYEARELDA